MMARFIIVIYLVIVSLSCFAQLKLDYMKDEQTDGTTIWKFTPKEKANHKGFAVNNGEITFSLNEAILSVVKYIELSDDKIYTLDLEINIEQLGQTREDECQISFFSDKRGQLINSIFTIPNILIFHLTPDELEKDSGIIHLNHSFNIDPGVPITFNFHFLNSSGSLLTVRNISLISYPQKDWFGDNLVPNGSFELYTITPKKAYNSFQGVTFWQSQVVTSDEYLFRDEKYQYNIVQARDVSLFLGLGTPDLISPHVDSVYKHLKIPDGKVCARVHFPNFYQKRNNRVEGFEYLQVQLLETLEINVKYEISMYVKLDENSRYSSNCIGTFLSEKPLVVWDPLFEKKNKLHSTDILFQVDSLSKTEWLKVSMDFIAKGNEQFITIGCFESEKVTYSPTLIPKCKDCYEQGPVVMIDDVRLVKKQN